MSDGQLHVGLAVRVESGNKLSSVIIPDITGLATGSSPIFIDKPIRLNGDKLKVFLANKGLPDSIKNFIADAEISCEAFYYKNKGPVLMMFDLTFNEGLLKTLIGEDIGGLFDIKGASCRIFKCPKDSLETLKQYVAALNS